MITIQQRVLGGLWGSLVGDALGVPVEFQGRDARRADPVLGMRAFGTHNQPAGTWSDDGSLLLCSAESLVEKGFDTQDMGERFVRWYNAGHWSAHGEVFDVGNATASALTRIPNGVPAEQAGGKGHLDNGNGSLMRILPVVLASQREDEQAFVNRIFRASAITHGHLRSQMACVFYGMMVRSLVDGLRAEEAIKVALACFYGQYERHPESGVFRDLLSRDIALIPESEIRSGGYVMETLTASLWCLLTTRSYADCVLKAVNLGWDADTTGCVAGGLAGVCYGHSSIPSEWLETLPRRSELKTLLDQFTDMVNTR